MAIARQIRLTLLGLPKSLPVAYTVKAKMQRATYMMTVWMYDDRKVALRPPVVVYTHTEMGIRKAACTHTGHLVGHAASMSLEQNMSS